MLNIDCISILRQPQIVKKLIVYNIALIRCFLFHEACRHILYLSNTYHDVGVLIDKSDDFLKAPKATFETSAINCLKLNNVIIN